MKVLIVYDSFFGNTEKVAQAMGAAIGAEVLRVSVVQPEKLTGLDALIVGSPTRAFRPSPAIQSLLKSIPAGSLKGAKVAAFDTRVSLDEIKSPILRALVNFLGYAAAPIAKQLTKKGGALALPPEGFAVLGTEGPLKEGELERAASWAKGIVPTS